MYREISKAVLSEYLLIERLGSGHYSKVYLAHDKRNDRLCAIKVMRLKKVKKSGLDPINGEIKIHSSLSAHPYVAQFYRHIIDDDHIYIIMEYCGSDLFDSILNPNLNLNQSQIKALFTMICYAIRHCHSNNIIHGDIKPENFGFYQGKLKLFDFGLSQFADKVTRRGGTRQYIAPESTPELSSDVWSAGIILYELLFKEFPDVKKLSFPKDTNLQIINLITNMLNTDPKKRYSIDDVLKHPFFQPTHIERESV
jgi:serine/threonine protein kinase